jgi:hypothetical protein
MSKTKWHIAVTGKWGGGRSFAVRASSEKQARDEARSLMRSDESIRSVYNTKES